jgi:hypothetical protein
MLKKIGIIVGSLSLATIAYLLYIKRCYSYLKRLGYDGPKPKFLLGNLAEFVSNANSTNLDAKVAHYSKTLQRWTKTYGKIYGYYEGTHSFIYNCFFL